MRLRLFALALAASAAAPAWPLDLLDTWRAAAARDPAFAAARAARDAGTASGRQAAALWRPTVALEAGAGVAGSETATRGARFAAPGFGQSGGAAFDTSVDGGASTQYAITLRQPLVSAERQAQQRQLLVAGEAAEAAWNDAQQGLMLRSAQRYLDAALAEHQLRLVEQQAAAVERARIEAQDRFRIGDRPITDVHEATARAAALQAQRLAAANALELKRQLLEDLTGMPPGPDLRLPGAAAELAAPGDLQPWLARAASDNPRVRLAEANVRNAEQEAAKTSAALSPTLDLVAQLGRERLSGSGDFGDAKTSSARRSVGVQLTLPLFTGGWRGARHDQALALLAQSRAERDAARQQAVQQLRAAWLELSVARERSAALDSGWRASLARLDATRVGLQAGDRTTLDLLQAANDAAAAELALLQSRAASLQERLRLAALAGSLDEAELAAADRALAAVPPR